MQNFRNISYHEVLKELSLKKIDNSKKLKIYGIYTFNPMKLNNFLEFFLKSKNFNSLFFDDNMINWNKRYSLRSQF